MLGLTGTFPKQVFLWYGSLTMESNNYFFILSKGSILTKKYLFFLIYCKISLFVALHPSQQLWSCRGVASISWDFYLTLGCHDMTNCARKYIRKTYPCNEYPLIPHFYIAKLVVCRGIPIFLIFAPKHRLWVLVRTASARRF